MTDTTMAPCGDKPVLFRALTKIPLIGWQLEGFCRKEMAGKALALANVLMAWLLAILLFGYPAFIIPVMAMAPAMAIFIIALTRSKV